MPPKKVNCFSAVGREQQQTETCFGSGMTFG